jgi:hypothetical protein
MSGGKAKRKKRRSICHTASVDVLQQLQALCHIALQLRRRNQRCSPLTSLMQLWRPYLLRIGAGLGRQTGRSCCE